jgi:MFS family permease
VTKPSTAERLQPESTSSDTASDTASDAAAPPPYPRSAYAWYVVVVLMVIYVCSFIDRTILNLLVEPIKHDLHISDTGVSLLQGLSFAIFYTMVGLPIGRLVDSRSRRAIIAVGVFIWSLMAATCGLARTYVQLLLARMGVGVGEAALSPAAYSLLADYFPPHKLGRAYSVYSLGVAVGASAATIIGGMVVGMLSQGQNYMLPLFGEVHGWQVVLICTGLPGMPLALLMLTVREPFRRGLLSTTKATSASAGQVPFKEVLRFLAVRWRTYAPHFAGFSLLALLGYGVNAWLPTMLIRTHGMSPADVGKKLGAIYILFSTVGMIGSGILADRLTAKGYTDGPMRVGLGIAVGNMVFGILVPQLPINLFWPAVCGIALVSSAWVGISAAALNQITPNQMRGQTSAIYLFFVNMLGLGFGPSAVALLTDYVLHDPLLVRHSLSIMAALTAPVAAFCFWRMLPFYRRSVEEARAWGSR